MKKLWRLRPQERRPVPVSLTTGEVVVFVPGKSVELTEEELGPWADSQLIRVVHQAAPVVSSPVADVKVTRVETTRVVTVDVGGAGPEVAEAMVKTAKTGMEMWADAEARGELEHNPAPATAPDPKPDKPVKPVKVGRRRRQE